MQLNLGKKKIIAKNSLFGIVVLSSVLFVGCATRSTPPAPILYVTGANSNATAPQMTSNHTATSTAAAPATANNTANSGVQVTPLGNNNQQVHSRAVQVQQQNPHQVVASRPVVVSSAPPQTAQQATPPVAPQPAAASSAAASGGWVNPTHGGHYGSYNAAQKGIDITGKFGQGVYASNSGRVVYSGNGLKGYGNLIIIKHHDNYLTAYAHNQVNLVKEGDLVKSGQKIAKMGKNDSGKTVLHFEVRKNGKPVNPSSVLH